MGPLAATENISSKSPLLTLPNELLLEVAAYLKRFRDLNALLRTSRFFHTLFRTLLYRRAITANDTVRDDIVSWVLSNYRVASLTRLLDHGLSANHKFTNRRDLLRTVCRRNKKACSVLLARLLLEQGADIEAKDARTSITVLHTAVRRGNLGIVALLLAHGADVNVADKNGWTALYSAAYYGHRDIATLLVAHGADVNIAKNNGWTPLHHAAMDGYCDLVTLLLAHGADVDAHSKNGLTPLVVALRNRRIDIIPVLLAHGADACAHGDKGRTPLHVVSAYFRSDDHELAKLLLDHGADVNASDFYGRSPLCLISGYTGSFWADKLSMAEFLLENGADVNATANDGRSPLQNAVYNSSLSKECRDRLVALLKAHGADTSALNRFSGRRCCCHCRRM
jgi:ankyrin repeat protein